MSEVYLAMSGHREMETLCVVKRLLPALLSQPEQVQRFRHEADLSRRLVHSNLVHTHNVGEVNGEVFLVQEFVDGHDLSALLEEMDQFHRALPVGVAVYIASELARGLTYAHAFENLDLVHRDINLPNVRISNAGEVKLLDFGIASSNLHGAVLGGHGAAGKLWHLAPEQVRPEGKIDRRTDIYAVGVVLWELLTQKPVGTVRENDREGRIAETEGEVLLWITRGQHVAPSVFNPEVSPELDALVAKATHVAPEERYQNADDLRRALAAFIPSGLHPEQCLAGLMKDLFPPEKERAKRHRIIEAGRSLLDDDGRPRLEKQRSGTYPKAIAVERTYRRMGRAIWGVPVAIGAGVGLLILLWLHLSSNPDKVVEQAAGMAGGSPGTLLIDAAIAKTDPFPGAKQPEGHPQSASPSNAAANVPNTKQVSTEVKEQPTVSAELRNTGTSVETHVAKVDHLSLARHAFNARDWPRALTEGKSAVAAGGGAEAHALMGNTYFKMGQFAEAVKAYSKAVALDPKNMLLQERLRIAQVRAQTATDGKEP
jgi:serine/threonine protein kinase